MKRILVSLIGGQTIPNISFIRQKGDSVDQFLFLNTEKMIKSKNRDYIVKVAKIDNDKLMEDIVVDPERNESVFDKLCDFNFGEDDEFIVNLTGGTKMMALGAYQFFSQKKSSKSFIYYIPIDKSVCEIIYPLPIKSEKLTASVSVPEYMDAHGVQYQFRESKSKDMKITERFLNSFVKHRGREISLLRSLRDTDNRVKNLSSKRTINLESVDLDIWKKMKTEELEISRLLAFIREVGLEPSALTKAQIEYIIGGWLEEYAANIIMEELNLAPPFLVKGVSTKKENADNEIDVIFSKDRKLFIVECKTVLANDFVNDALYKLNAISQMFSLATTNYLFTTHEDIKDSWSNRAKQMRVKIIGPDILRSREKFRTEFIDTL